ncbi:MAG: hypothetical protein WB706_02020, partial [Nitrososphaeraceae archaeon]
FFRIGTTQNNCAIPVIKKNSDVYPLMPIRFGTKVRCNIPVINVVTAAENRNFSLFVNDSFLLPSVLCL